MIKTGFIANPVILDLEKQTRQEPQFRTAFTPAS